MSPTRISFVCLGNICRSPMAEGVFTHLATEAGRADQFEVESAGVGPWHTGEPADRRAQATARAHGLHLTGRAKQIKARDFARLDVLLALDGEVAAELRRIAPTAADRAKIHRLREYDPLVAGKEASATDDALDVPDPYYGGPDGFEDAYQMIDRSCRRLLATLQAPR